MLVQYQMSCGNYSLTKCRFENGSSLRPTLDTLHRLYRCTTHQKNIQVLAIKFFFFVVKHNNNTHV